MTGYIFSSLKGKIETMTFNSEIHIFEDANNLTAMQSLIRTVFKLLSLTRIRE